MRNPIFDMGHGYVKEHLQCVSDNLKRERRRKQWRKAQASRRAKLKAMVQ